MSTTYVRTLAQLAEEALAIQDASNLTGLTNGWHEAILELRRLMPTTSTVELARHPINKLWAFKLQSLTGRECLCQECMTAFGDAYGWARDLVTRS